MSTAATFSPEFERATYKKVTWRLIPFLFLCYILAYLDRVNVGFAKLQMNADLGFSETVYGIGAGMFFIGYFFFEVPSNLLLARIGARVWIARIMITWGILSSCMMFVEGATSFYVLRFLLGVAEAGFFPGIILYLTYWYTQTHRAHMVATFMTAITLAGVFGGPLSGWILSAADGVMGLAGWRWLYFWEGVPSVVVGMMVFFRMTDNPGKAKWLTEQEKRLLLTRLHEEEQAKSTGEQHSTFMDALKSIKVWLFCLVYFGIVMGTYGITFWLPTIIRDTITKDPWMVGWISAIPWGVAAIAMVWNGAHSDKTGERRWHIALACFIAAAAFAVSAVPEFRNWWGVLILSFATAGVMAAVSCFWSLPTAILSGTAAAAGIAWINSVGNLAGYVSPHVVGAIKDATGGNMTLALFVLAGSVLIAGLLVIYITGMKPKPAGETSQAVPYP